MSGVQPLDSQQEAATAWQREEDAQTAREASERSAEMEADPDAFVREVMAQAEAVAAGEMEQGDDDLRRYLRETVGGRKPFTKAQALFATKIGRRDLLIAHNLLLVVDAALRWWQPGRSLMDLIGAGNIALVSAAGRFDHTRNIAFSTFSLYQITASVRAEAMAQDTRFASLPLINQRTLGALRGHRSRMSRESGAGFSLHETAALLRNSTTPPPQHAAPWPDPAELSRWLATTNTHYLSQLLWADGRDANSVYGAPLRNHSLESSGHLADPSEDLAHAEARADIWALSRDLGTLTRYHVLSRAELRLIVLRYGIPHPDPAWRPPVGWRLAHAVSLREMARLAHRKREWARQDFYRATRKLDTDPSEIAKRASATLHSRDTFAHFYASG